MMGTVVFNFVTRRNIRSAETACEFFAYIQSYIPDARPKIYGDIEPFRSKFDEDGEWMYQLWGTNVFWRNNCVNAYGRVLHHFPKRHTTVKLYFDDDSANSDPWCGFLKEVSALFDVDYSCIHFLQNTSRNEEDEKLEGVTSLDLQDWLPTVAWAACYGAVYINLIGASKFEEAEFYNIDWISDELIFCQLTADASDYIDNYEVFRNRQLFAKTSMGLQYFYDPANPHKKGVVPTFTFG